MTRIERHKDFYDSFSDEELLDHIRDTASAIDLPWQVIKVKNKGYTGGVGDDVLRDKRGKVKVHATKRSALKQIMSKVHDHLATKN